MYYWQNQQNIKGTTQNIWKKCYRCSGTKHTAQNCPFKEAECFYCHLKGHTIQVCRKKAINEGRDIRIPKHQCPVNVIETTAGNEKDKIFEEDEPLAEKVSAIKGINPPTNVTELKAFLGIYVKLV